MIKFLMVNNKTNLSLNISTKFLINKSLTAALVKLFLPNSITEVKIFFKKANLLKNFYKHHIF